MWIRTTLVVMRTRKRLYLHTVDGPPLHKHSGRRRDLPIYPTLEHAPEHGAGLRVELGSADQCPRDLQCGGGGGASTHAHTTTRTLYAIFATHIHVFSAQTHAHPRTERLAFHAWSARVTSTSCLIPDDLQGTIVLDLSVPVSHPGVWPITIGRRVCSRCHGSTVHVGVVYLGNIQGVAGTDLDLCHIAQYDIKDVSEKCGAERAPRDNAWDPAQNRR